MSFYTHELLLLLLCGRGLTSSRMAHSSALFNTPFTLSRLRPRLQSWCETRSYRGDLNRTQPDETGLDMNRGCRGNRRKIFDMPKNFPRLTRSNFGRDYRIRSD